MRPNVVRFSALAAALLAAPAAAQVPLTPRTLGVANSYVAGARFGAEALWLNPANMALPNTPHWSFAVPVLSVGADALGLTVGDLWDLREYDDFGDQERQDVLDRVPPGGTDVRIDARIPIFTGQIRRVAFGVSYNTLGNHTFDRDFADLLLFGFVPQPGRYNITPEETQGFRATYVDFAAGYAHRFGPVSVGATGHYYLGRGMMRSGIVDVDTVISTSPDLLVTYAGVGAEGGRGFGLDLGVAARPRPDLTLSASVSNVVNTFAWDEERVQDTVVLSRADYQGGDVLAILDRFDRNETVYDEAAAPALVRALAADLDRDTDLPRTLRAGAAWQVRPATLVTAAYTGNLADSRVGGLWERSLGVGVQHDVKLLSFRAGLASNLDSGMMLSGGFSVGFIHLGLARISDGAVDDHDRTGWVATFGLATSSQSTMR